MTKQGILSIIYGLVVNSIMKVYCNGTLFCEIRKQKGVVEILSGLGNYMCNILHQ